MKDQNISLNNLYVITKLYFFVNLISNNVTLKSILN